MKSWREYKGHKFDLEGKRKKFDTTIYSFDIETTSYLILDGKILPAIEYDNLTKKEQERCIKQSNMYIWMFSINTDVYYGRTWEEFKLFLNKLYENSEHLKIVFIHNLAFEFHYLKSIITFDEVFARTPHKPIKAYCKDYNIEFRCTYMMSNCKLANLPKVYNLPVEKKVGDLDYTKIRHSETPLTEKELGYCEYDCLVIYYYIKFLLNFYDSINHIPKTNTGQVREELKSLVRSDYSYKTKVRKAINTDGHIYNLLAFGAFAGGFTHANYIYADEIISNVTSWDFTSSYPYCLCCFKFPMTRFRYKLIKRAEDMSPHLAYLIVVNFKNIRSKYFNNFISKSKCKRLVNPVADNGRIMSAEELEIVVTDVDFRLLLQAYEYESYEIKESYYSVYKYLPKKLINFILDKYVSKTKYKNDPEHEIEYAIEKARFNSIYGMTVTNDIRDSVDFKDGEWLVIPFTNADTDEQLEKRYKDGFLEFSWGVWTTSYARTNLQYNIMKLDEYQIYADTDSMKVREGYDINVIENYNKEVLKRLKRVSEELDILYEKFAPKDIKGIEHPLGVFDNDGVYKEFITQGAKKYAYKDSKDVLHITVSGVPKSGVECLNSDLNNFRNDLVFDYSHTNKNTLMYSEGQLSVELEDYLGNTYKVTDVSGICLLPTTYVLGKAEDYMELLNQSTDRYKYKE